MCALYGSISAILKIKNRSATVPGVSVVAVCQVGVWTGRGYEELPEGGEGG